MAVIGINYSGGNFEYNEKNERVEIINPKLRLKYKSVYIHYGIKKLDRIFKSGNFVKDWFDAKKYYIDELQEGEEPFSQSSTCEHFFSDGAEFDSAYLHMDDNQPVLRYIDRTDPNWFFSDIVDGWEFFVEKGTTPTWEELKELCGHKKQTA